MKIYFLIFVSIINKVLNASCVCPTTAPSAPQTVTNNSSFVVQNEIIGSVNYGKPIVLGQNVFLSQDFPVNKSISTLGVNCPYGYAPPTADVYSKIIASISPQTLYQTFTNSSGFNGNSKYYYLTSTKTYPTELNGSNNNAWMFQGLFIDNSTMNVSVISVNTYFSSTIISVKCMFIGSGNSLTMVESQNDFVIGYSYPVSLLSQNLLGYYWSWGSSSTSTSKSITVNYSSTGCNLIQVWANNLAGSTLYGCSVVWSVLPFGSDGDSTFSSSSITAVNLNTKGSYNYNLFFNSGSACVAPKATGGLYLLYTSPTDNITHVIEFDSSFKQLSDNNLGINGLPEDIVATDNGFVVFLKNSVDYAHAFIAGFDSKYNKLFQTTIMDNGPSTAPTSRNSDQLSFYDSTGTILGGMQVMFDSNNAKLAWGRGRIGAIFAHYNNFGTASARDDHTGDTYYNFDANGVNTLYAWPWLTSHSLTQSHIYDGRYFVTAALGDAYPQNIQVCFIDMIHVTTDYDAVNKGYFKNPSYCSNLVITGTDTIPGGGDGSSCGRMGGIHAYNSGVNGMIYAVSYLIHPCSISGREGNVSTSLDELGIITFNFNNLQITNISRKSVQKSGNTMNMRSAKYGNKILIAYSTQAAAVGSAAPNLAYLGNEVMYYMLVDFNGNVKTSAFQSANFTLPASDSMKVTSDGRAVWGYVDPQNTLSLLYTSAPPALINVNTTGSADTSALSNSTVSPSTGNSFYLNLSFSFLVVLFLI